MCIRDSSNIIFIDENNKILDSAKHVDFTVSAVRQILPGFIYELPPSQDKLSPEKFDMVDFMNGFARQDDDIPVSYTHLDVYKRQRNASVLLR